MVVNDLDQTYIEPTDPPVEPFDTSFAGQEHARTCWEMLSEMIERTASDLDSEMFAVLDDRSVRDESALLVLVLQRDDDDAGAVVESVRVDLKLVSTLLLSWMAKGGNISEIQDEASQAADGVARW